MPFRLNALGSLVVTDGDEPVGGSAAQRRVLALLAYLAAAGERGVSREKVIGLLWPDTTDERARHALAQTLYRIRRYFGADSVAGTELLRLDGSTFAADVTEFERALAHGHLETAAALYRGPYLDGFVLPDAPDFERWAEMERARLAAAHRQLLERLALAAEKEGNHARAAEWWRAVAAVDRLNSRVAARLVDALTASEQRAAALAYARVHETLMRDEMNEAPPPEFLEAVNRALSHTPRARAPVAEIPVAGHAVPVVIAGSAAPAQPPQRPETESPARTPRMRPPRRWRNRAIAAAAAILVLAGAGSIVRGNGREQPRTPTIAVGYVADFTGDETANVADIVAELLTTNLSRLDGITLVTRARLLDLMDEDRPEPASADFTRAAQLAGVGQLIDGALYREPDGALRLDVRVLDATTGRVRQVHAMEATDAFALADSATTRLATGFGLASQDALRIAEVTTSSIVAFRFYEEGLRALRRTDMLAAQRLFDAALRTDSTFAMAAFGAYHAYQPSEGERALEYLEHARRVASRATERERLIINATWARSLHAPGMVETAEEVVRRFPADPESHLLMAQALLWSGNFPGALLASRQVVLMDSTLSSARCLACEALEAAATSYVFMDSLEAAARLARQWIARDDSTQRPWRILRGVAMARDDLRLAAAAHRRVQTLGGSDQWEDHAIAVELALRSCDFLAVAAYVAPVLRSGRPNEQVAVLWWQTIAERTGGQLQQALRTVERLRRLAPGNTNYMQLHAQVMREMRQYGVAAALFDSAAARHRAHPNASQRSRHLAWVMTQRAGTLAAAGIVDGLPRLADSIEMYGGQSAYGRDPRLHYHVRGLWHAAQGRTDAAIDAFRRAMWSPTGGYTRTNLELARLLVARGQSHDAISVLRAALVAGFQSVGLYTTQTELRALLAVAHARVGTPDSAQKHREWVTMALAQADPEVRDRIWRTATAGIVSVGKPASSLHSQSSSNPELQLVGRRVAGSHERSDWNILQRRQ